MLASEQDFFIARDPHRDFSEIMMLQIQLVFVGKTFAKPSMWMSGSLWRSKYLGERWWPIWSQRRAPRSVRSHSKHHPSLRCHCFLLKLTYRWERKSKRTGRRCIWEPEHCGCCCPGRTLPHSYIKGGELGSREISACCTLPAVFKKQMCRTKQWQGQWGNWTSVLGKYIEEEGENHSGWGLHCGSRAQTGGHLQASWENSPKSLVYSFSWSHVTQFVDIVCIRERTEVSRLWGYVFLFKCWRNQSGNSTEGQRQRAASLPLLCKSRGGSGGKVRLCHFLGLWTEKCIGTLLWNSPGVSEAPYPAHTYSCRSQNTSVG